MRMHVCACTGWEGWEGSPDVATHMRLPAVASSSSASSPSSSSACSGGATRATHRCWGGLASGCVLQGDVAQPKLAESSFLPSGRGHSPRHLPTRSLDHPSPPGTRRRTPRCWSCAASAMRCERLRTRYERVRLIEGFVNCGCLATGTSPEAARASPRGPDLASRLVASRPFLVPQTPLNIALSAPGGC